MTTVRVQETAEQVQERKDRASAAPGGKPAHWADPKAKSFLNPWPSWQWHTAMDFMRLSPMFALNAPKVSKDVKDQIPIHTPTWGTQSSTADNDSSKRWEKLKATWLGHACFLLEFPSKTALIRGPRVLFDPVFSDRCSPSQFMGPKRFTPAPCQIEDIPEVDVIIISHNHYDHLDTHTISTLLKLKSHSHSSKTQLTQHLPHIFAPLGNAAYFRSLGVPDDHVHILDWWDSRRVEVQVSSSSAGNTEGDKEEKVTYALDITCTPCQHFTGRGVFDRFKTLWASWAVEEVSSSSTLGSEAGNAARSPLKVWFGGDTGYRTIKDWRNEKLGKETDDDEADEEKFPTCPVFKEIGEKWASKEGFDLALIPIGAYLPRSFMSNIHCAPQDSVRIFKDVRAKRALGMHWGTWVLTTEEVTDPPKKLQEECRKAGIEDGVFGICDIGETVFL